MGGAQSVMVLAGKPFISIAQPKTVESNSEKRVGVLIQNKRPDVRSPGQSNFAPQSTDKQRPQIECRLQQNKEEQAAYDVTPQGRYFRANHSQSESKKNRRSQ